MPASCLAVCFQTLAGQTRPAAPAQALFFNHLYDPISLVRDNQIKAAMAAAGVHCRSFNADVLFEPWLVLAEGGRPDTCCKDFWVRCVHVCLAAGFKSRAPHVLHRLLGSVRAGALGFLSGCLKTCCKSPWHWCVLIG